MSTTHRDSIGFTGDCEVYVDLYEIHFDKGSSLKCPGDKKFVNGRTKTIQCADVLKVGDSVSEELISPPANTFRAVTYIEPQCRSLKDIWMDGGSDSYEFTDSGKIVAVSRVMARPHAIRGLFSTKMGDARVSDKAEIVRMRRYTGDCMEVQLFSQTSVKVGVEQMFLGAQSRIVSPYYSVVVSSEIWSTALQINVHDQLRSYDGTIPCIDVVAIGHQELYSVMLRRQSPKQSGFFVNRCVALEETS